MPRKREPEELREPPETWELVAYNVREAAAILRCSTRTVRNYIKAGKLRAYKVAGRWTITRDALEGLIKWGASL